MDTQAIGSALKLGGVFTYEHVRNGEIIDTWDSHNLVVNQGLNHVLDVALHGSTQTATWYIGVFEGNYQPLATDTAATIVASSTECTAYTEGIRQIYNEAAAASQVTTNVASKATFTFNATKTIYGAFLSSVSTLSATTGVLLAADKAGTAKSVTSGDQLLITYAITLTAV